MRFLITFVLRDGSRKSTRHEADTIQEVRKTVLAKWKDPSGVITLDSPGTMSIFPTADIANVEIEEYS